MDVRNSLLWTQLRADGWCPFELIPLFNAFNTPCLYFLRNLRQPSPHKSHQVIRIRSTQHSVNEDASNTPSAQLCSAFKCGQLNDDSYCTNHTGGCYDCQEIRADSEELRRILKDGKIPLILSLEENDKNGTIILVEADPSVSYVAISHVWSDGLGNTKRNDLPRCQLLRLSKMIRNLPGHHSDILHFWVNTICVPPNAARLEGAQLLALGLMPKTYEDATAVLVLDSWLLSTPCNGRSDIENITRIFSSAWNSRLWTYQEGALAKVLYFQFEDTVYNLDEAARNMRKIEDAIQKVSVVSPLMKRYYSLRRYIKLCLPTAAKFLFITHALSYRVTSMATEPIYLAGALGLDVAKIQRTEPELRMQTFWRLLPINSIPRDFVFSHLRGLKVNGLHWAPETFLRNIINEVDGFPLDILLGYQDSMPKVVPATLTEQGLNIEGSGFRFVCGQSRVDHSVYIQDESCTYYMLTVGAVSLEHNEATDAQPSTDSRQYTSVVPWEAYNCEEVAFL